MTSTGIYSISHKKVHSGNSSFLKNNPIHRHTVEVKRICGGKKHTGAQGQFVHKGKINDWTDLLVVVLLMDTMKIII